jgi:hypothetical protein
VTVGGFLRSVVYPVQWMGLMMTCCGMAVKMGMLSECEKMKALTVNTATATLIGTGRWNMTCSVY